MESKSLEQRMYVIVRRDLRLSQIVVQSSHAVAEFLKFQKTTWRNGTMVVIGVSNELELNSLRDSLEDSKIEVSVFYEPDVGEDTALAFMYHGKCPLTKGLELI